MPKLWKAWETFRAPVVWGCGVLSLLCAGCAPGSAESRAGRIGAIERWSTEHGVSFEQGATWEHYFKEFPK